jgi:hypothetical protein
MSILLSLLSGGITGLLGKGIERYFDHKAAKLEAEREDRKFEHQLALQQMAGKAAVEVEDSKAFKASIESDDVDKFYEGKYTNKQAWLMVLLDFARGFVRIGLTAYLCILTTMIYIKAERLVSLDTILPSMAYDLVTLIINTILYMTTLAVCWQFGSRASNAPVNKK